LNRFFAGIAAVLLFHSLAIAAPHIFKVKPEPVEKPGVVLRERMARKFGAVMRAPGNYPASVNILFLRVEFQANPSPSTSLITGSGVWVDPLYAHAGDPDYWVNKAGTDFINYWKEVSYNKLIVSVVTSTAIYKLPSRMSQYGNESNAALENLIYDSVTAAKADIDFTLYDAILIVHAGCGEESDILNDSSNDIWSLYYSNNAIAPNANPDSNCSNCLEVTGANGTKRITEAIIMPQSDSQDNYTIDPLGVYVHELGHWLGLPDLYCTGLVCLTDGVGKWSLMGDGIYNADPSSQADQSKHAPARWKKPTLSARPTKFRQEKPNVYSAVRRHTLTHGARHFSAGLRPRQRTLRLTSETRFLIPLKFSPISSRSKPRHQLLPSIFWSKTGSRPGLIKDCPDTVF
jgi:M6 family metalloprotease-like protein